MTAGKESPAGSFAASAKAGRGVGGRIGCPPPAAFTLMEILISLALVALLIGATISVVPHDNASMTTDEVFWKALTEARKQALTSQQDVRLAYDNKAKAFVTGVNIGTQTDAGASKQTGAKDDTQTGVDGVEQTFPVAFADKLNVDFLTTDKSGGSMLIGGELVETQSLPFVTFYSDGTCTPFRMQIHSGGAARIIAIDPWTCAEVLEEKK
ncbi:MAG TPA: prepilin-type N-terminal cleavage/methylation domain-containing protein [Opitutaceae bacterium]|jgi:prepilin-type N-terminal cleavage/methylation domain-containing protein|nr:prepilin-type N-terminal cleavage/methylation domain-containing protein [Opitutaceae bacterium]